MSTPAVSPFLQGISSASGSLAAGRPEARSVADRRLRALDALLDRPCVELQSLYRDARAPRLGEVAGDLRGRMLAWPSLESRPLLAGAIRALAGSRSFPWRGKSFHPKGELGGEGINRVVTDRLRLFRFETFIGKSKAGDFDALQLDYDLPENPPVIRSIKDEIREIDPGLWLGQAYLKTRSRDILWLYFALARVDA